MIGKIFAECPICEAVIEKGSNKHEEWHKALDESIKSINPLKQEGEEK